MNGAMGSAVMICCAHSALVSSRAMALLAGKCLDAINVLRVLMHQHRTACAGLRLKNGAGIPRSKPGIESTTASARCMAAALSL